MSFKKLGLSRDMLETLVDIGFEKPSEIQAASIPPALAGKDIIGQAHTGTGKTAAFGIPIIETIKPKEGLQTIVLAPSRELAVQIYNELIKLSAHKSLTIVEIIGGISYVKQRRDIKRNPEIIVATPGRFIDLMESKTFDFSNVLHFVLDEADEMLSFGFLKEIKKVYSKLPENKQTFFFTATFNKKIKTLADSILKKPINIQISDGLSTTERVNQKMIIVKENQKLRILVSILQTTETTSVMIFGKTRRRVNELSESLNKLGFKAIGIQGDMRQKERSNALKKFRDGQINILIGTDVLARGLDIEGVDYVFNFDLPTEIEYYTHRIGRTGRADKKGVSISFVKDSERSFFNEIMKKTSSTFQELAIPSEEDISKFKEKELSTKIEKLLVSGTDKYKGLGQKIASKYSKEELGIIIANELISQKANVYDMKMTGETGANVKRGGSSRGKNRSRSNSSGNRRPQGSRTRASGGRSQSGSNRRRPSSQNRSHQSRNKK